jgi:hypothetical protein
MKHFLSKGLALVVLFMVGSWISETRKIGLLLMVKVIVLLLVILLTSQVLVTRLGCVGKLLVAIMICCCWCRNLVDCSSGCCGDEM